MATGDQSDMQNRLVAALPASWFTSTTPVLSTLISAMAWALSFSYSLITYAKNQTRIATASDGWLDLIAADLFGAALTRNANEGDNAYRIRILANLLRQRATRYGVIHSLYLLTGRTPVVFEPLRPADTGAYGASITGYGSAGGYGSYLLPAQFFVKAYRPATAGIPNIAGYGFPAAGYGAGQAEYCDLSNVTGVVTDASIYANVDATKPAGTCAWVQINN